MEFPLISHMHSVRIASANQSDILSKSIGRKLELCKIMQKDAKFYDIIHINTRENDFTVLVKYQKSKDWIPHKV